MPRIDPSDAGQAYTDSSGIGSKPPTSSLQANEAPHAFRHARAVSMLRATVSVKDIGDLLGHRAADSTLVYLKLATEDLRAVALEIPTGVKA